MLMKIHISIFELTWRGAIVFDEPKIES